MKRAWAALFVFWVVVALAAGPGDQARRLLELSGVKGGLVVHVGCGDGRLTAALRASPAFLVHGLDRDPANVRKARAHIRSLGLYGPVSAEAWNGGRLPYADNLVALIVASDPGDLADAEAMRVLRPGGVVCTRDNGQWKKVVKPWPQEIDQWTHWLHDASNNAVAQDRVVGPPRSTQWVAGPRWQRHHEFNTGTTAFVSAGGRIFYTQDEAPATAAGLPDRWMLVAREAFSGVLLWKRPMGLWGWKAWSTRQPGGRFNLPLHVPKRLVAVGERVYVTLGFNAPVSELDAATGKTLRVFANTKYTDEILYRDGLLVLAVNKAPQKPGRIRDKPPVKKEVVAINARSGRVLWRRGDYVGISTKSDVFERITELCLTVGDGRVFLVEEDAVVCLDLATGREMWRSPRPEKHTRQGHIPYKPYNLCTLVTWRDVVLFAQAEEPYTRKTWNRGVKVLLTGLSASAGKRLWARECSKWGPGVQPDVFVIDGLVWTHAPDALAVIAIDPHTGEVKRRLSTKEAFNEVHHHRCFRNKATVRYLLTARRGIEFTDLASGSSLKHHWVRGACRYGILPANGLVYVPPHPCQCYITEKLSGFFALASSPPPAPSKVAGLERGPAYSAAAPAPRPSSLVPRPSRLAPWPTYRHDIGRSGASNAPVPAKLKPLWEVRLATPPSACTIAEGKVFVAWPDEHRVCALDADDGKLLWEFVAGGRVDTPPTIYRGLALFGSADGWVYALRAEDGALAWRFRPAPAERRIVAFGQLESAWPVHGSVLVKDGVAYVAAGRSTHLDGGIRVCALDPRSGKMLRELKPLNSRPHGLDDILVSDGKLVYMRHLVFSLEGGARMTERKRGRGGATGRGQRLYATTSLLDPTCFCRVGWTLGGLRQKAHMLVFDDEAAYAFGTKRHGGFGGWFKPGTGAFTLAARERKTGKALWTRKIGMWVRAMVLAGPVLFLGGAPDVVDKKDPWAALEGRRGGLLCALSAQDGKTLATYKLSAPPLWDGMAAGNGRLFVSTQDGSLVCFGPRQ